MVTNWHRPRVGLGPESGPEPIPTGPFSTFIWIPVRSPSVLFYLRMEALQEWVNLLS